MIDVKFVLKITTLIRLLNGEETLTAGQQVLRDKIQILAGRFRLGGLGGRGAGHFGVTTFKRFHGWYCGELLR